MIRILTLAAAAMLIAAPASAQSARVSTAGKSAEQLHVDIDRAAKSVCRLATTGATFPREMYASCYKAAMKDAVAKAGNPALTAVAAIKLASR
jgi:hypothetical protein